MGSLSELEPPCGEVAEPPNKSFERDASIACFSSIFLAVRLCAAHSARLNSGVRLPKLVGVLWIN
jgi:hypothetical protein